MVTDVRLWAIAGDLIRGRAAWRQHGRPRPLWHQRPARVASFDVFDTLIGSSVARPSGIRRRLAEAVADHPSMPPAAEVDRARLAAEHAASARTAGCPTLEEIHRELERMLGPAGPGWKTTAALEVDAERELSRRIEPGVELLARARAAAMGVLFISDMYLPSGVIRELLVQHGCWEPGDSLWVSGEARATKRSGDLFKLVLAHEGLAGADVVHVGDHPVSDRIVPRWLGVGVRPFTEPRSSAPRPVGSSPTTASRE